MEAVEKIENVWVLLAFDESAGGAFEWEAHLDVGAGEGVADEVFVLGERGFPEFSVCFELAVDEGFAGGLGDCFEDRAREHGALFGEFGKYEFEQEQGHGGAFRVVHPVAVLEEVFGVVWGAQKVIFAVFVDDVFDDGG